MPFLKLLQVGTRTSGPLDSEWHEALSSFSITSATGIAEACEAIADEGMDCVLLTGPVPGATALEILDAIHRLQPTLPLVIWDPEMGAADAVRLIRAGAYNCIGYRDGASVLRDCLENAAEERRSRQRKRRVAISAELWHALLIGESPAMKTVYETIRLVGPRRCNVLIT